MGLAVSGAAAAQDEEPPADKPPADKEAGAARALFACCAVAAEPERLARYDREVRAQEMVERVEEKLASFSFDPSGRAVFTLANGARWQQIDNEAVLGEPRPGEVVVIESAAPCSFKASIAGRRTIRVRRLS